LDINVEISVPNILVRYEFGDVVLRLDVVIFMLRYYDIPVDVWLGYLC
jgi:hypothetical protein